MERQQAHALNALIDRDSAVFTLENVAMALDELAAAAALVDGSSSLDAYQSVLFMAGRIATTAARAVNFEREQLSGARS
ncbi:hypothetical protein DWG20_15360 [Crenobacter cavernae]|uniref:Uncharacterized protein n=2 Tax=Crenobacter cavernae TaxID=2290923 RepID=A0A345Y9T7_9NEIS|nr:hypothetical protein DWG20_15360 [Crenobacter cavernae]